MMPGQSQITRDHDAQRAVSARDGILRRSNRDVIAGCYRAPLAHVTCSVRSIVSFIRGGVALVIEVGVLELGLAADCSELVFIDARKGVGKQRL